MRVELSSLIDFTGSVSNFISAMKSALVLAATSLLLVSAMMPTALAAPKSNRIRISYEEPKNPEHIKLAAGLKEHRRLERFQEFLSPFSLPRRLTIKLAGCDGEADAFYGDREITICYEYVQVLIDNAPAETTSSGIEPIDTIIGPLIDTGLHEFAHALFDMLDIPVLGREEDAADQVSAYIYLQLGVAESHRLIAGTAYAFLQEASSDELPKKLDDYADDHSTPEQRAYNVLCMGYGADPKLFGDVVGEKTGFLPKYRAETCEEEYEQVQDAYEVLIEPHVDKALARKIFDREWLNQRTLKQQR